MKRTPLKSKTPLKRKAFKAKRKRIKPVSEKRKREGKIYSAKRLEFLVEHQACQMKLNGCTKVSTDVHHSRRRGIYFLDVSTWIACCRSCHEWVESHPREAREMGFLK